MSTTIDEIRALFNKHVHVVGDGWWHPNISDTDFIDELEALLRERETAARLDEVNQILALQKSPNKNFKIYDEWLMCRLEERAGALSGEPETGAGE